MNRSGNTAGAGLTNKAIAQVFREVETLLGVLGEDARRAMTYGSVARLVESLPHSAADLAAAGRLREVRGIGPAIESAVAELIVRGSCTLRDDLAARLPPGVLEILRVPGLGPKRVHTVVHELSVTSLEELDAAAADGRLAAVKGFGARTSLKVREGIAFLNQARGRMRLSDGWALAHALAAAGGVRGAQVAGPARRGVPVLDALSIVALGDPSSIAPEGMTLENGVWVRPRGAEPEVRLRLVSEASFARALFEETGPPEHVASVLALGVAGGTDGSDGSEEEIYRTRGLSFVPPERRHACDGTTPVPALVTRKELRGLVHAHTRWSDGAATVMEMAAAARERGYSYLTVTDHSRAAAYAGGLSIERLRAQAEEIAAFNASPEAGSFRVLHGSEVDILPDGSLDYPDEVLESLDLVIASVHSSFGQDQEAMTARIECAARHPHVDVLGHPTGMLRLRRSPYAVDMERVLNAAAESGCSIELNANPWRLDLDPELHDAAVRRGIGVPINPDAHSTTGMDDVDWGVLAARHGGLRPEDVPNTRDVAGFLEAIGQ